MIADSVGMTRRREHGEIVGLQGSLQMSEILLEACAQEKKRMVRRKFCKPPELSDLPLNFIREKRRPHFSRSDHRAEYRRPVYSDIFEGNRGSL